MMLIRILERLLVLGLFKNNQTGHGINHADTLSIVFF